MEEGGNSDRRDDDNSRRHSSETTARLAASIEVKEDSHHRLKAWGRKEYYESYPQPQPEDKPLTIKIEAAATIESDEEYEAMRKSVEESWKRGSHHARHRLADVSSPCSIKSKTSTVALT